MLVQVVGERVPAAADADHHVRAQNLRGFSGEMMDILFICGFVRVRVCARMIWMGNGAGKIYVHFKYVCFDACVDGCTASRMI